MLLPKKLVLLSHVLVLWMLILSTYHVPSWTARGLKNKPIWLNICKKHISVRRSVPAQKSARKSLNTPPKESCITAVLKTASKRSYTYTQSKTAQSLQLPAFPCSIYPASILPRWDLSWILLSMQCTTQHQHTHTCTQNQNMEMRKWSGWCHTGHNGFVATRHRIIYFIWKGPALITESCCPHPTSGLTKSQSTLSAFSKCFLNTDRQGQQPPL